jgi:hypothetical protein
VHRRPHRRIAGCVSDGEQFSFFFFHSLWLLMRAESRLGSLQCGMHSFRGAVARGGDEITTDSWAVAISCPGFQAAAAMCRHVRANELSDLAGCQTDTLACLGVARPKWP